MKKSMLATLATVVLAGSALVGCGGGNSTSNAAGGSSDSSQQSVSLDLLTEPPTLDPAKANDTTSGWVMNQVLEGLTILDQNDKIVPGIAEKWDVSPDGKTYTFHLRDNAKWTNGDPVKASDFVYAIKHTLDPNTGAQFASYLYYINGAEAYNTKKGSADAVGVKAVDEHTLQFTLKNPTPFFLNLTSFWPYFPVDEKVATSNPQWTANANTYVSDGPFKISSWNHQQDMTLVKNPDYYNASSIKLNQVKLVMVNDTNTQYQMFQSGQLDMDVALPQTMIQNLINSKKAQVFPFAGTQFLELNVKKKPFDNVNIRKALAMALDRNSIAQNVLQGGQTAANGMVPPGIPGASGTFRDEAGNGGKLFNDDVNQAKQLLAQGLKEEGLSSLPAITLSYNSGTSQKALAEALQQMWTKNLGITVNLQTQEWKVYLDSLSKGNFEMARMGWINVYQDPTAALQLMTSTFGSNYTGWKNPQYDQLVAAGTSEIDPAKRMQDLHQAEQLLVKDMPFIPINYYTNVFAFSPKLGGIVTHVNAMLPDVRYMYVK